MLSWLKLAYTQEEIMHEVGAFEAKNTLGSLLDRVERGEEVLITRHGKPVARLTSVEADVGSQTQARAAFDRIRKRAADLKLGPFDWPAIRQDRDAGRP
jgi:prevent-host-death family protein